MTGALWPFLLAARHARALLVAGLVAGIAAPGLATIVKPWLAELVAGSLFAAALRIGPRQAVGAIRDLAMPLSLVLIFQLVMPVTAILVMGGLGWLDTVPALALILMLAAAPIAGSPSLTVLVGHDPAPALRLLVLGTLMLPLTVLPVLWLMPALGTAAQVLAAAGRLLAVIGVAVAVAFVLRRLIMPAPSLRTIQALDGLAAILVTVILLGLMSAVGPALREEPAVLLAWLAAAVVLNLGLQMAVRPLLSACGAEQGTTAYAIIAGNRNIALFLVALPHGITDQVLVFIGAYQIPMYLTPVLMRRFYAGT